MFVFDKDDDNDDDDGGGGGGVRAKSSIACTGAAEPVLSMDCE